MLKIAAKMKNETGIDWWFTKYIQKGNKNEKENINIFPKLVA